MISIVSETISRAARSLLNRVLGAPTAADLALEESPLPAGFRGMGHVNPGAKWLRLAGSIRPGWYMLELRVEFDGVRADARICLEGKNGDRAILPLPMRSGQLVKRLVFVETPTIVRLLPLSAPRAFEVIHFRLARVPERFARSRIERKLAALHPRYMPQTTQSPSAGPQSDTLETRETQSLWQDYNRLYDRNGELVTYDEWIEAVERRDCPDAREQAAAAQSWPERPTFSIIVRTHDDDEAPLRECLNSVLEQTYSQLELCVADDGSSAPHVRRILWDYAARDPRMRVVFRESGSFCDGLNAAIALGQGEYIGFLRPSDVMSRHALFSLARALHGRSEAEIVYSDEDKLDQRGRRHQPFFKPDFARDLLYSQNYISHLALYRRQLVQDVGGSRPGFEGSEEYDLLLRCVDALGDDSKILHVPEVLYHTRDAKGAGAASTALEGDATEGARRALSHHLERVRAGTQVSVTFPGLYRVHWPVPTPAPLVTLIIPTRDRQELLAKCVNSIRKHTTYPRYEILIVDNQSQSAEALAYLDALAREEGIRVVRYDAPFNYSAINNFAAREARGSVLGLINNDVEVINGDWLTELVSHALRPDVGCVGAKLYYPDDTIQHAGVVLGIGGIAGHSHKHFNRNHAGYYGRLRIVHNVAAVTAAALVVRRDVWDEVGGLNETELPVAFNDVDFCLRVMAKGYRNVWTPHAELYHDESRSRGSDEAPEKAARFRSECEVMRRYWGPLLQRDPYYSPHLTLVREDYSLRLPTTAPVPAWGTASPSNRGSLDSLTADEVSGTVLRAGSGVPVELEVRVNGKPRSFGRAVNVLPDGRLGYRISVAVAVGDFVEVHAAGARGRIGWPRIVPPAGPLPSFGIGAIFRNEGPYVTEWLAHHRLMGFQEFFIADNDSDDGTWELLQALQDLGYLKCFRFGTTPGEAPQLPSYIELMRRFGDQVDWMGFIDADEFIWSTNGERSAIPSLAGLAARPDVGAIVLNWALHGSSGHVNHAAGLVTDRFQRRAPRRMGINHHYKTVLRTAAWSGEFINPHHAQLEDPWQMVHANGAPVLPYSRQSLGHSREVVWDILRLNHYAVKSQQEFQERKRPRGRAAHPTRKRDDVYFATHDRNDAPSAVPQWARSRLAEEVARLEAELISAGHPVPQRPQAAVVLASPASLDAPSAAAVASSDTRIDERHDAR